MTWTEHSDGVFSKRYASLNLNVGVIVCEDGLLVIDTRAHHRQARELLEDLKQVSSLPVRWVINTHHHWDHTFGNGEFFDAEIWGHQRCARHLADGGMAMLEQVKALAPDQAQWFDEVSIVPPSRTFDRDATAEFGGREVSMQYLGRGHTDNDIVIRIEGGDVAFAGDLIEESAPPAFGDAFPLEWPATVEGLEELITGPVIPGHGDTVDRSFVSTQREELAEVARVATERHDAGMTIEQAAAAGGPYPESTMKEAFGRAWRQIDEAS